MNKDCMLLAKMLIKLGDIWYFSVPGFGKLPRQS